MNDRTIAGKGPLTDADRARIDDLAQRGFSQGRIAQLLKKHPSTVQWYMYTAGLKAPGPAPETSKVYVRNGVTVRTFSAEEDAFIQALRIQEYSFQEIAELSSKRFNARRTGHSVRCRLIMLAAREDAA